MAEYESYPLWESDEDGENNIGPDSLPISTELVTKFNAWMEWHDSTFDKDEPQLSGFPNAFIEEQFIRAGVELAAQLQEELGSGYKVLYRN